MDNKMFVLVVVFVLVFTVNLTLTDSNASTNSLPSNIEYDIPILITNSQNVSTPNPFQQIIKIPISKFSSYIYDNNTSANFEFYYKNGTIIPSWIESVNSTTIVVWLKLYSIPADSSITIYMGFASKSTNLLSNSGTAGIGEAPQLSKNYGQYDDGKVIFPYYQSWGHLTSLPNNWSSVSGTSITYASNYTEIISPSSSGSWAGIYLNPVPSYLSSKTTVWDFYGNMYDDSIYNNNGFIYISGEYVGTSESTTQNWSGYSFSEGHSNPPYIIYLGNDGSQGYASTKYNDSNTNKVYTMQIYSGKKVQMFLNYTQIYSTNNAVVENSTYFNFALQTQSIPYEGYFTSYPIYIYWLRVRVYPPNGVMPSVLFGSVSSILPPYQISFKESGLVSGIEWNVRLNNSTSILWLNSTNSYANFTNLYNGSYNYQISVFNKWYSIIPLSGKITVNGGNVIQSVTFDKLYEVNFVESGLSSGVSWQVTFDNIIKSVSTQSVSFSKYANGTYMFSISPLKWYLPVPRSGSITISGSNVTENIKFNEEFILEFHESGLALNTTWNMILNGKNYSTDKNFISLTLESGNYSFSIKDVPNYSVKPENGTIDLFKNTTENITFSLNKTYSAIFIEKGLSNGIEWLVEMDNNILASTSNKIIFSGLENGTYSFKIKVLNKWYLINPETGNITINGSNVTENISFSQLYSITFNAIGLSSGIEWEVSLNSNNLTSTSTSITFLYLNNGNYSYKVFIFSKWYLINNLSGNVTVNNFNVTENIYFTRLFSIIFIEKGLPIGTIWSLYLNSNYYSNNSIEIVINYLQPENYSFSINRIKSYMINPQNGIIHLINQNVTQNINFSLTVLISLNNASNGESGNLVFNSQFFSFDIGQAFLIYFVLIIAGIFMVFIGIASVKRRGR